MVDCDNAQCENNSDCAFKIKMTFGKLLMRKKDFKRALEQLEEALEIEPRSIECRQMYVKTLLFLGRDEEAIEIIERLLREITNTGSTDEKEISLIELETKYLHAEALYNRGEFEKALTLYQYCYQKRSEKDCFRKGLQCAKEAIMNSLGRPTDIKLKKRKIRISSKDVSKSARKSLFSSKLAGKVFNGKNNIMVSGSAKSRRMQDEKVPQNNPELRDDIEFLNNHLQSISVSERNSFLHENLSESLRFLKKQNLFWRDQKPMYARANEVLKIKRERQKCILTPSYAAEAIFEIDRGLKSENCKVETKSLDRALEIYNSLENQKECLSLINYTRLLCNYYYSKGSFKICVVYAKKLCHLYRQAHSLRDRGYLEIQSRFFISELYEKLGLLDHSIKWLKSIHNLSKDDYKMRGFVSINTAALYRKLNKDPECELEASKAFRFASLCSDIAILKEAKIMLKDFKTSNVNKSLLVK